MTSQRRKSPTAEHLHMAIIHSRKTLRQICNEVGFARSNVLTMMQNGTCKVPIQRIPALAEACGVPAVPFVRIAMQEYHPEVWHVMEDVLGGFLAEDEVEWLDVLRATRKRQSVKVDTNLWLGAYMWLTSLVKKRGF